ncbi:helix-turn-helix domain-containing protein [Thermogemmatispora sp.]|uniref:helix-turn-helix domain-containing protein n=1 Tax=Thermogemmatispora sp. TaxID=1968838 RepID=UPI0035E40C47
MKQGHDSSRPPRRRQRVGGPEARPPARTRGRHANPGVAKRGRGRSAARSVEAADSTAMGLTPFSLTLQRILKRDRALIAQLAGSLGVSENTIYRWMNGQSEPRPTYLRQILEVMPEHRRELQEAIEQSFPNVLDLPPVGELPPVERELYRQVLELRATIGQDDSRRWQMIELIFEAAIKHLDPEQRGLALTYAELMPPRPDGIHSLYEAEIRATSPWVTTQESRAFLGSTTLAGTAAMLQRLQVWSELDREQRHQFVAEEFERSACACPVLFASRCSGVLIVSSTRADFFSPSVCQAVNEYALLVALALPESAFYDPSLIHLRPMPDIRWQREEISRTFVNRVIAYARRFQLSRPEAERRVRMEMEEEFEQLAPTHFALSTERP